MVAKVSKLITFLKYSLIVIFGFSFNTSAFAEYYFVTGPEPYYVVSFHGYKKHRSSCHTKKYKHVSHKHYRRSYAQINEYYVFVPNNCGCCGGCATPWVQEQVWAAPDYNDAWFYSTNSYGTLAGSDSYYGYRFDYDNYDADLTTGDDNVYLEPGMSSGY